MRYQSAYPYMSRLEVPLGDPHAATHCLNAQSRLDSCLQSIRNRQHPQLAEYLAFYAMRPTR